jgi:hypothetical protein
MRRRLGADLLAKARQRFEELVQLQGLGKVFLKARRESPASVLA